MKKISIVLFAIFSMSIFLSSTDARMIVHVKPTEHDKTIALYVANLNKQFTHINVVGLNGEIYYTDQVWNKWGYNTNLDLSTLTPGDYVLYIKNRARKVAVALFITNDRVAFVNTDHPGFTYRHTASYMPTPFSRLLARFSTKPNQSVLDLQLANLKEGLTTIKVSSLEGCPVYTEQFSGENGYNKTINLEGVYDGLYYVYLNTVEANVFQMMDLTNGNVKFGPTMGKEKALLYAPKAVAVK